MSLYERIQSDLIEAMKARDRQRADVLKMLVSSVKYYLASSEEARKSELTDQKVIEIIKRQVKQREESKSAYEEANRTDLANKEHEEALILQSYLPTMLTEEEIRKVAQEVIEEVGARGPQDLGRVMKTLMSRTAGSACGKTANRIAAVLLNKGDV